MKGKKLQPGTFVYREMIQSKAFLALKGFAPQLLLLFLLKRQRKMIKDKKGSKFQQWIDDNLTMTYVELQKKYKITKPKTTRAIDDLLAKGFLKIRHAGGAYKKDKTIYALSEEYLLWRPGVVFNKRNFDVKRGYQANKKEKIKLKLRKNSTHVSVPIHGHVSVPLKLTLVQRNRTHAKLRQRQ